MKIIVSITKILTNKMELVIILIKEKVQFMIWI